MRWSADSVRERKVDDGVDSEEKKRMYTRVSATRERMIWVRRDREAMATGKGAQRPEVRLIVMEELKVAVPG